MERTEQKRKCDMTANEKEVNETKKRLQGL